MFVTASVNWPCSQSSSNRGISSKMLLSVEVTCCCPAKLSSDQWSEICWGKLPGLWESSELECPVSNWSLSVVSSCVFEASIDPGLGEGNSSWTDILYFTLAYYLTLTVTHSIHGISNMELLTSNDRMSAITIFSLYLEKNQHVTGPSQ